MLLLISTVTSPSTMGVLDADGNRLKVTATVTESPPIILVLVKPIDGTVCGSW